MKDKQTRIEVICVGLAYDNSNDDERRQLMGSPTVSKRHCHTRQGGTEERPWGITNKENSNSTPGDRRDGRVWDLIDVIEGIWDFSLNGRKVQNICTCIDKFVSIQFNRGSSRSSSPCFLLCSDNNNTGNPSTRMYLM